MRVLYKCVLGVYNAYIETIVVRSGQICQFVMIVRVTSRLNHHIASNVIRKHVPQDHEDHEFLFFFLKNRY